MRAIPVLAVLGGLAAGIPTAWYWISTVRAGPEEKFWFGFGGTPTSTILAVDHTFQEPVVSVRVLRWGEHCGSRHGPYSSFDDQGRLRELGQFDRGRQVGVWFAYHPSTAMRSEYRLDESGRIHGHSVTHGDQIRVESEYSHGYVTRWRLVGDAKATPWIIPPLEFLVVGLDGKLQSGLWMEDGGDQGWFAHGTSISIGESGWIDAVGPYWYGKKHGLWTYYGDDGEIEQQDIWLEGVIQLGRQRTEPPWYDLAPCFDPSVPIAEP